MKAMYRILLNAAITRIEPIEAVSVSEHYVTTKVNGSTRRRRAKKKSRYEEFHGSWEEARRALLS